MLFQSATFVWAFLLPVVILFYAAARFGGTRWALWVLVVASLIFYGWSRPGHLVVLLGSIAANYLIAGGVIARRGTRAGRALLVGGLVLNLGLLAWFKYSLFAAETIEGLTGWELGWHAVVLPLGISFFTFQKIAYLVDAWRGYFSVQRLSDYALFVTFFPQLIAGPIVHHTEFFPQLGGSEFGRWRTERMVGGGAIFVLGLAKKLLLADVFAKEADRIFGHFAVERVLGAVDAWLGVLAYTFQIYFDFSAYSDMAIGLALLFGITLPENFAAPYRATSIIEFWRRWHMTLSRFLRDYLYIPLGGSRGGAVRQARSLAVTMVLGGLWHGAAWTFVAWGAIHGVALTVNHLWRRQRRRLWPAAGWVVTFFVVASAWVCFRSPDFATAGRVFRAMFGLNGAWSPGTSGVVSWIQANRPLPEYRHLYEFFGYMDWRTPVASTGLEWRDVLFGRGTAQLSMLALAFALTACAPPAVRWLWNLETGRARFSTVKAVVVGGLLVAVILQGIAVTPSTFIYFRF